MTWLLYVIFFLSGASALIFESLWFQLAGLTFGNSVWASAIVLASFMGGLALGNGITIIWGEKIISPVRCYALLEIAIAITGFALVCIFPMLTEWLVPLFQSIASGPLLQFFRAAISFFLMLIPAMAMGATLPILVKALYSQDANFGNILGILYGFNTLGAVLGIIVNELFLVKWFGIVGAGLIAAILNIIAAILAICISHKFLQKSILDKNQKVAFSHVWRLLMASFLSGMALLMLEVIWFRFMLLFFDAYSWNFAVMLAVVLLGISCGGLVASSWLKSQPQAHHFLVPMLLTNALLIVALYIGFYLAFSVISHFPWGKVFLLSMFLMFPISLISGIVFTMLGKALHEELETATKTTGCLILANTLGAMLGSLVAGWLAIPYLGIEKSFFLLTIGYGAIALLLAIKKYFLRQKTVSYALGGIWLLAIVFFPFGTMDRLLLVPNAGFFNLGEKRMAVKEGIKETIQYFQKDLLGEPYYHRLVTNAHSMSATNLVTKRYMKLFVYWPVAVRPNPKNALLICFGCGATAKALTETKSLKNIDIVDISRDVIQMSQVAFPKKKKNPVNDPRVKVHIEDGRFFLLTTKRKYDLITAEPPPPTYGGVVNLYTQEYFQLIYDRLSKNGIVTYWLPVYQLHVEQAKSILKGFCNVFPHSSLWIGSGFEWMMVGIKEPDSAIAEKTFAQQWQDPMVASEISALGFNSPEQFGSLFIADGKRLQEWIKKSPPLVDNFPQRLSRHRPYEEKHIKVYRDFMDSKLSLDNFLHSKKLALLWPKTLRKKTERHFWVRETVNDLLIFKKRRKNPEFVNLHQCITNELLSDYVLWVLGSNQYAQKIIQRTKKIQNLEEVYVHLAAQAAQNKKYLQAENYLRMACTQVKATDPRIELFYTYRMYFLYLKGQKIKALALANEYIETGKADTNRTRRKKKVWAYWEWLEKTFK